MRSVSGKGRDRFITHRFGDLTKHGEGWLVGLLFRLRDDLRSRHNGAGEEGRERGVRTESSDRVALTPGVTSVA